MKMNVGLYVGFAVRMAIGFFVGLNVGFDVCRNVGRLVGETNGALSDIAFLQLLVGWHEYDEAVLAMILVSSQLVLCEHVIWQCPVPQ